MNQAAVDQVKNGHVVNVYWKNDDPNEPNVYKPRPVIILDKYSETYCLAVGITDLDNIDLSKAKGIQVLKDSDIGKQMRLTKNSFVNFNDCKNIPTSAFINLKGKCPNNFFDQVLKGCT